MQLACVINQHDELSCTCWPVGAYASCLKRQGHQGGREATASVAAVTYQAWNSHAHADLYASFWKGQGQQGIFPL